MEITNLSKIHIWDGNNVLYKCPCGVITDSYKKHFDHVFNFHEESFAENVLSDFQFKTFKRRKKQLLDELNKPSAFAIMLNAIHEHENQIRKTTTIEIGEWLEFFKHRSYELEWWNYLENAINELKAGKIPKRELEDKR